MSASPRPRRCALCLLTMTTLVSSARCRMHLTDHECLGATARLPPLQACSAGAEEYSVECAVCYMYDLDGCVPEIACDGCSKPFHKACLYEWLSALPSTRQSFNRLFGECPYCSRPVTVEAS